MRRQRSRGVCFLLPERDLERERERERENQDSGRPPPKTEVSKDLQVHLYDFLILKNNFHTFFLFNKSLK